MASAYTIGKITSLRLSDSETLYGWGPPGDRLACEVVAMLDSAPDKAFGFIIERGDPHLASRLAILAGLKDAFVHDIKVSIGYNIEPGKHGGHITACDFLKG